MPSSLEVIGARPVLPRLSFVWFSAMLGVAAMSVAQAQRLDEVVVTASRSDESLGRTLTDVVVIRSQQIRDAAGASLAELLRAHAGVEIAQNGGVGSVTGIFLRGTKTAQTVVMVDGVRLENPLSGFAPIELIPLSAIERIEVVRGPSAVFYGSGAIGGVIQIFTREGRGPARPEVSVAAGSFGTAQLQARLNGGDERTRYMFSALRDTTRGFDVTRPGSADRQIDADGNRQTSFTGLLSHRLTPDLQVGAQLLSTEGRSEWDSSWAGSTPANTFTDYRTRTASLFARGQWFSAWDSEVRVGSSNYDYNYGGDFAPRTSSESIGWQNALTLAKPLRLLFGADHRRQSIEGPGVTEGAFAYAQSRRTHQSLYSGIELEQGIHQWRLVGRNDRVTGLNAENTALLAWGVRPAEGWLMRASAGSAYRVPTFDDMFNPWGANPALKPERSEGQELALERHAAERFIRVIAFRSRIRDAIELDSNYVAQNLAVAKVLGVTTEASLKLGDWRLRGSLTRQQPTAESPDAVTGATVEAPLARRARAFGVLGADWGSGDWRAGVNLIAQGRRFDTGGAPLGGYAIIDVWGSHQWRRDLAFTWRVGNLTDREYETALGFRSPPRLVLVGVRYSPWP